MRTFSIIHLAIFSIVSFSGCHYAILYEDGLAFFRGPAAPTSVIELVEAQRVQKLSDEQITTLQELKEKKNRERLEIYSDAQLIQELMDGGAYAAGTIGNKTNVSVWVEIYENEQGNNGRFVQKLGLGPEECVPYMLENGKYYIFSFEEKRSGVKKRWVFQNPARRGWYCGYEPQV